MMKRKTLISIIAVLTMAFALLLTGCGGSDSEGTAAGSAAPAGGKTLIYGSQDYTAINPALFE